MSGGRTRTANRTGHGGAARARRPHHLPPVTATPEPGRWDLTALLVRSQRGSSRNLVRSQRGSSRSLVTSVGPWSSGLWARAAQDGRYAVRWGLLWLGSENHNLRADHSGKAPAAPNSSKSLLALRRRNLFPGAYARRHSLRRPRLGSCADAAETGR